MFEDGQSWTPREIHALIKDRYGITSHLMYFACKRLVSGIHYVKPRPMDPRSLDDADEILADSLSKVLGEDETDVTEELAVLGFFHAM